MAGAQGKDAAKVLSEITKMLDAGLETQIEPFPESAAEFANILDELRALEPDDIKGRLVIGGFLNRPNGPLEARCQECIYFLVHRRWCDLPELAVPVEPDWWCRLWKI